MSIALISFTESGRLLSAEISDKLTDTVRYCFFKHTDGNAASFSVLAELMTRIFGKYDALVFVSAVGIAVRAAAPHIVSKTTDPAVIAVDDNGRFAVSVLSGHIGGANSLTRRIAGIIGAVPVITTATDSHSLFSPDMFAQLNGLIITDMTAAKAAAAAVVNGEKTGFRCAYPFGELPEELSEDADCKVGICISGDASEKPFETTLNLLPRDLAVGIGCKKGTDADMINRHIMTVFSENRLDVRRIAVVSTIDLKSEEEGLLAFCERSGIPLRTYTAGELMNASGEFSHSDFVMHITGADNVCERAAVCAGGKRIIVRKTGGNGVTAAVAEIPVRIRFERSDD